MTNLKNVAISEIRPDPNQPRRIYDETAMQELTQSVKEKGILQPILIRPNGKGFILVCGERRFRAATSAGLAEMPAVIRELTDEEAFELQIIENLQRKDVHPMEEAIAYKSYQERKSASIEELSAKFAKSKEYIAQRLSFNSLIKPLQDDFYSGLLMIGHAVLLARLQPEDQKNIMAQAKNHHHKDGSWYDSVESVKELIEDDIMHELGKAPFDKRDDKLIPKAGSCLNCPKRSGSGLLFADVKEKDRCFDAKCYEAKKLANVRLVVDEHISSGSDMPVISGGEIDKDVKKTLDGHKVKILREYTDYYETNAATGIKALCVGGHDAGKIIRIRLEGSTKKTSSLKKDADVAGPVTTSDIDNEIQGIKSREKRSKELDQVKVWDELKKHFRPSDVSLLDGDLTPTEREAIATSLYNKIGYSDHDAFNKMFAIKKGDFSKVDNKSLVRMLRFFFLSTLPPNAIYSDLTPDALTCVKVAGEYFPTVLKDIQDNQAEIARKRAARVAKRIADLQAKKK